MPAGGTPPNPWKNKDGLFVFSDPELGLHEIWCCDSTGRHVAATVEIPDIAGFAAHPDVVAALWRAAGNG